MNALIQAVRKQATPWWIVVLLVFCSSVLHAQELHTTDEILKIMADSPISYHIDLLDKPIKAPDRADNLSSHLVYQQPTESGIEVREYQLSEEQQQWFTNAEELFAKGDYKGARELYLQILQQDSTYSFIMTYVGQTYGIEGNFTEAKTWYRKAIQNNHLDYMARWFLADALLSAKDPKGALQEITMAHILNRNNPRIFNSFKNIYAANKLKTPTWNFNPQYSLDSTGPKNVTVAFTREWLGYALVKAVWRFEPGYAESMGGTRTGISTTQEREALLNFILPKDKKEIKKMPELNALQMAMDKDLVTAYIFYEIILPQYPNVASQVETSLLDEMKQYVIQVRGEGK
jgi:tetratricopeptide (TPR) repeat protein